MSPAGPQVTGWVGWVWYAAIMLIIVGAFDIVQGIVALVDDTFAFAVGGGLLVVDLTTWGWIHVIVGAILVLTGIGLWSGQTWARVLGVVFAGLNALVQLTIMPAYPIWAMVMILLNVVVIYALVVHGREASVV